MQRIILAVLIVGSVVAVTYGCLSSSDCASDECCVTFNRPIGKKRESRVPLAVCTKLGKSGSSCYVDHQKLQDMNFACPCAPGYGCLSKGYIDVPLGEVGTCTPIV